MNRAQTGSDEQDTHPLLAAGLDIQLAIGSVRDEVKTLGNRIARPGRPLRRRLDGLIKIPASGNIDGFVDLGNPSQGEIWTVRTVYFGPGSPTANHPMMRQTSASADLFSLHSTGSVVSTGITGTGDTSLTPYNTLWAKASNISFTGAVWDDPSADACNVVPQDHLIAAVWGGTAGQNFAVSVVVEVFQTSRSRQVVEV